MNKQELILKIKKLKCKITLLLVLESEAEENGPFDLAVMWSEKIYKSRIELIHLNKKLKSL